MSDDQKCKLAIIRAIQITQLVPGVEYSPFNRRLVYFWYNKGGSEFVSLVTIDEKLYTIS